MPKIKLSQWARAHGFSREWGRQLAIRGLIQTQIEPTTGLRIIDRDEPYSPESVGKPKKRAQGAQEGVK